LAVAGNIGPVRVDDPIVKVLTLEIIDVHGAKVEVPDGVGSGFFVSDGIILTSAHVVEGSSTIYIHTSANPLAAVEAELVAMDMFADIALLHVDNMDSANMRLCPYTPEGYTVYAYAWRGQLQEIIKGVLVGEVSAGIYMAEIATDKGFSGGPVRDEDNDCVLGLVTRGFRRYDRKYTIFVHPIISDRIMVTLMSIAPGSLIAL
jgi:hypothetical protein